ncbi:MAG: hypothetical protein ABSF88_01310 [Candidatus Aminicenantales bacterium]
MRNKEIVIRSFISLIIIGIIIVLIALIAKYPTHQVHATILEYLRVILTWPGVIFVLGIILLLFFGRFMLFPREKIKFIELEKPEVTGFIQIIGKTDEGDIIIKADEKYKIADGDAIVNKAFILKFNENLQDIKSMREKLEKYQNKLLEK